MLNNVAVAELSRGSMKATSLASPFAVEGFEDKEDFYKSLAPKKAGELKELELDTVQCVSNDIQLKIKIGQNLLRAKKICKHGEFLDWLKACFAWSEDTATRQMRLAEKFQDTPGITRFTPTVAYQLSQKSCPDVILEQAIALLDAGEKVTTETVKELKQSVAEEPTNLNAVNPKLSKTTRPEGYIKKGDLVEMQYPVKGWSYGRVVSKSSDGIVCKVQSLDGQSLGEKPTKSLSLCPVQKINPNCISGNIELNQKVIVKPYTTELQPFNGNEGKVIFRDEKRRQFSVQFGDMVKDFHWEEVELIPDEPTTETTIDIEAVDVTEETEQIETPSNIDLKAMSMKQKGRLLKELVMEMRSFNRGLIPQVDSKEIEDLVEKTLARMDSLEFSQRSREQFVIVFLDKCL